MNTSMIYKSYDYMMRNILPMMKLIPLFVYKTKIEWKIILKLIKLTAINAQEKKKLSSFLVT